MNQRLGRIWAARGAEEQNENERNRSDTTTELLLVTSRAPHNSSADVVAKFGMILRDSEFKGYETLSAVREWAQEGKGADENGYWVGFLELVRKARELQRRM